MQRFDRRGFLAVNPRAFFDLYMPGPPKREAKLLADCSIIEITGPLVHHEGGWCDSYDAISARVDEACKGVPSTIILKIDSPGGDALGCMDTAREIRAKCDAAGKRLIAFVDGMACSAAYAFACVAEYIALPQTGIVGSIGVIHVRVDVTKADAMYGTQFSLITSGARKSDNNPHVPVTEAELAETQKNVDFMAGVFFELVAEMRGVSADQVAALEARMLPGAEAVSAGLADTVQTFDQLLASIAAGTAARGPTMAKGYEDAIAALRKAAEGDDDEAKKAKRMLKAELDEEPAKEEPKKDDAKAKSEGAEPAKEEPKEEPKKDDASASVSAITAGTLAATVSEQGKELATLRAQVEGSKRTELLASRPDIDESLRTALSASPLAEVERILKAMPKKAAPNLAATAVVPGTRGAGQVDQPVPGSGGTELERQMDARMGMTTYDMGIRREGTAMVFGVVPAQKTAPVAGKEGAK